ncbi:MAG: GGDEF domain-containing protein [Gammaproteobacteria bacterium]|nr:GGDEF domain-containing protein [Gammaproteobacteria bacterium]
MSSTADDRPTPGKRRAVLSLTAVLCLLLIGFVDYYTGPEIASLLFYVAAVALAAWTSADLRIAVASGVLAALVWAAAEWLSNDSSPQAVLLWNAASRLVIFCGTGILFWKLKRALDLAHGLARTDYVTDLLNARAFHELAKIEISRARRYHRPLTVAYFDLDDFKSVNDRYGHTRGDAVLRTVGATLRASLRQSDTVARIGGDEFVLLLPEAGYEQAREVLAKLQSALTDAMASIGNGTTVSIGAAVFDVPPADVDALILAADAMMYRAKTDGKNRFRICVEKPAVEPRRSWRGPPASG